MAQPPKLKSNKPSSSSKPNSVTDSVKSSASIPSGFHNPYNFIPALSRTVKHPELGDHHPRGHGSYHADLWSGEIAVTLKTKTPLLIPDAAKMISDESDHKTLPVRVDSQGQPYLAPTAIKGMLRSAYEAVTNSRFGVFEDHGDRLAYRMPAKIGPIPARVEVTPQGTLALRLMKANVLGFAGKLPRYKKRKGGYP